jgi:Protein of unknown function (DUF1200).
MEVPLECRSECGDIFWVPLSITSVVLLVLAFFLSIIFMIIDILLILIMILLWYRTRYTFESDRLIVRMPLQSKEPSVDYSSVKKIVIPGGWSVVQGCSRNTIGIFYGKNNYVNISPVNRDEIIYMLRIRCPQARFEDKGNEKV